MEVDLTPIRDVAIAVGSAFLTKWLDRYSVDGQPRWWAFLRPRLSLVLGVVSCIICWVWPIAAVATGIFGVGYSRFSSSNVKAPKWGFWTNIVGLMIAAQNLPVLVFLWQVVVDIF